PAPGVEIVGTEGVRGDRLPEGTMKIPLGSLFGGQHREALVKVRLVDRAANVALSSERSSSEAKPIASVRLHFRDPSEGDLERVQETVARAAFTSDASQVAAHANAKTQAIMAVMDAGKLQMEAAQEVNRGSFGAADQQLAVAQKKLTDQAHESK